MRILLIFILSFSAFPISLNGQYFVLLPLKNYSPSVESSDELTNQTACDTCSSGDFSFAVGSAKGFKATFDDNIETSFYNEFKDSIKGLGKPVFSGLINTHSPSSLLGKEKYCIVQMYLLSNGTYKIFAYFINPTLLVELTTQKANFKKIIGVEFPDDQSKYILVKTEGHVMHAISTDSGKVVSFSTPKEYNDRPAFLFKHYIVFPPLDNYGLQLFNYLGIFNINNNQFAKLEVWNNFEISKYLPCYSPGSFLSFFGNEVIHLTQNQIYFIVAPKSGKNQEDACIMFSLDSELNMRKQYFYGITDKQFQYGFPIYDTRKVGIDSSVYLIRSWKKNTEHRGMMFIFDFSDTANIPNAFISEKDFPFSKYSNSGHNKILYHKQKFILYYSEYYKTPPTYTLPDGKVVEIKMDNSLQKCLWWDYKRNRRSLFNLDSLNAFLGIQDPNDSIYQFLVCGGNNINADTFGILAMDRQNKVHLITCIHGNLSLSKTYAPSELTSSDSQFWEYEFYDNNQVIGVDGKYFKVVLNNPPTEE